MAFTHGIQNKEYLQDEEFYVYVAANPDITRDEARVIDEIRWFMQTQDTDELLSCVDEKLHSEPGDPKANEKWCGPRTNKRPCALIYPEMTAAQLRFFVKKMENLHPEIKKLIESHPYHLPISSSVATFGMFSSDCSSTELKNQIKFHEFTDKDEFTLLEYNRDYSIPFPASLNLIQQQYSVVNDWVEQLNGNVNALHISSLPKRTYGIVNTSYNPDDPHGLCLNNDALKSTRVGSVVDTIIENAKSYFQDRYRLMDQLVPLVSKWHEDQIELFYEFDIEKITSETDPLGTKKNSKKIPNKILYAYIKRFIDNNVEGKYLQD